LKVTSAIIHITVEMAADLFLPIFGVELVVVVELSIAIVHDTTSLVFTILERMIGTKVVPDFMCEDEPQICVYLFDASIVASLPPAPGTDFSEIRLAPPRACLPAA